MAHLFSGLFPGGSSFILCGQKCGLNADRCGKQVQKCARPYRTNSETFGRGPNADRCRKPPIVEESDPHDRARAKKMRELSKEEIQKRILEIETEMQSGDFWLDKNKAQAAVRELQELKDAADGVDKYDRGGAVVSFFAGAGGDDAEDFVAILFDMYSRFFKKHGGWEVFILHTHENDHGGYRNLSVEVKGKNVYGMLKKESGVHRLVRISPFNAKKMRHTSFALVEVIPIFEKVEDFEINEDELTIEFAKSSGPGGQNVNKRETAVRIVHLPTKLSVHVSSERSQHQNKEKGMQILRGKIFKALEEDRVKKVEGMYVSKTTDIEWGSQIRSYVFHPYKLVKDHRTNVEIHDVESVLAGGIEPFLEAEKSL